MGYSEPQQSHKACIVCCFFETRDIEGAYTEHPKVKVPIYVVHMPCSAESCGDFTT